MGQPPDTVERTVGIHIETLSSGPDSGQDRRIMFRPKWKHARLAASVVASLVLTIVVAPVLGELAIAWLRKRHFYDDPDKTVAAMIAALHALMPSWWLQWGGGTIVGLSVGAWLDSIFGRTSKKPAAHKANEAAVDTGSVEARRAPIAGCSLRALGTVDVQIGYTLARHVRETREVSL